LESPWSLACILGDEPLVAEVDLAFQILKEEAGIKRSWSGLEISK
jgi:hypothetical protein